MNSGLGDLAELIKSALYGDSELGGPGPSLDSTVLSAPQRTPIGVSGGSVPELGGRLDRLDGHVRSHQRIEPLKFGQLLAGFGHRKERLDLVGETRQLVVITRKNSNKLSSPYV